MLEDLIYEINTCNDMYDLMAIAVMRGLTLSETERRTFLSAIISRVQLLTIF